MEGREALMTTTAMRNLLRMAEAGDMESQHALAVSYATGDDVAIDLQQARYWYLQAAEQGNADAAFNLGAMWLAGEGGQRSRREAVRWLKKASALGSGDASIWFAEKALAEQRLKSAVKFFSIAALQGDVRGIRGISLVLSQSDDAVVREWAGVMAREIGSL